MQTVKILAIFLVCISIMTLSGCGPDQCKDLSIQNDLQQDRIAELESQLQTTTLQIDQLKRGLETAISHSRIGIDASNQTLAALEEDLNKKKALIAAMQQQLLFGGAQLPVELSTMLEDFAAGQGDMVAYDSNRGVIKFKSDLLFAPGSDIVAPEAIKAVKSLCTILNSDQGKKFDAIIAGHTDDIRILKPQTREKHPTNWHLSAHRAISVLDVMTENNVAPDRLSVRGFGEFRPVEPNKPDKKGNPQNRRVEIYIIAKGV